MTDSSPYESTVGVPTTSRADHPRIAVSNKKAYTERLTAGVVMSENRTVVDILERVRKSRRRKRCPNCGGTVSIRGFRSEYRWKCVDCDSLGIGYSSRSAALTDIQQRNR